MHQVGHTLLAHHLTFVHVHVLHQVDQLTTERDNMNVIGNKAETERAVLERQNAELRAKLADLEADTRTRFKTAMTSLESRIANLEEQLDTEMKYCVLRIITYNTIVSRAAEFV